MRYPAVDMHPSLNRAVAAPHAHRPSILPRVHWLRLALLGFSLAVWPAVIYALTRLF